MGDCLWKISRGKGKRTEGLKRLEVPTTTTYI
jgi:hypothetical protein